MKYLGIDFGTKRIGIALSDDGGEFAFPQGILDAKKAISEIVEICTQESVSTIVIGYSIAANGAENNIVQKVISLKEKLAEKLSVPIVFEREDFSTVEAHRYQIKAGSRDDSAAAIILQRFLAKKKK